MVSVNGVLGDFTLHTEDGKTLITEEFKEDSVLMVYSDKDKVITIIDHGLQKGLCAALKFHSYNISSVYKHVTYELVYMP